MPKKSIVSRRRYVPPSIKERMTNADVVGDIRQYVNTQLSTTSTTSTAITTSTQPKKLIITNTQDAVKCFVDVSIVAPDGNIPVLNRIDLPVGAAFSLGGEDIPINPSSKGIVVTLNRNGSSGTAGINVLITF